MIKSVQLRERVSLLIVPAIAYLALFYLFPIVETLRLSFSSFPALANLIDILGTKTTWIIFWQTIDMALVVTAITLVIGYATACLLILLSRRMQYILILLILLPYWISTLVRSYAWIAVLGRKGVINWLAISLGLTSEPLDLLYNRLGAIIGMVNVVAPIMILILYAAFERIDRRLLQFASILGGRPFFVFGRVWLPLTIPGVVSGCILVFLISLGVFTTPAILGGATETSIAMAIEQQVHTLLDLPAAAALATLLLVVTVVILAATQRFWVPALMGQAAGSGRHDPLRWISALFDGMERIRVSYWKSRQPEALAESHGYWRVDRSRPPVIVWILGGASILYLLIPVVVVIGLSFSSADFLQFPPRSLSLRWFRAFFASPEWVGAARRSFVVAAITTAITMILALAAAYGIERGRLRHKNWVYMLFLSPLIVPPMIVAFGLYYIYAKLGWIGSLSGLAAAHVIIVLPYAVVTLTQGMRSIDPSLEFTANALGGRPLYVLWRIILPLLSPAMLSGALLVFLTSFDELIIALFLTSARSVTLPKQMWDSVRFEIDPINAAAATLLIALSVVIVSIVFMAEGWRHQASRPLAFEE